MYMSAHTLDYKAINCEILSCRQSGDLLISIYRKMRVFPTCSMFVRAQCLFQNIFCDIGTFHYFIVLPVIKL